MSWRIDWGDFNWYESVKREGGSEINERKEDAPALIWLNRGPEPRNEKQCKYSAGRSELQTEVIEAARTVQFPQITASRQHGPSRVWGNGTATRARRRRLNMAKKIRKKIIGVRPRPTVDGVSGCDHSVSYFARTAENVFPAVVTAKVSNVKVTYLGYTRSITRLIATRIKYQK